MDKYFTVVKKSTKSVCGEDKQEKQRDDVRYHPYGVGKSSDRKPGDWKEKRRMEK